MPNDRKPIGEVWWVYSPRPEAWGGLRIAHFGVTTPIIEGAEPFFILGEVPYRSGIRHWAYAAKVEGWVKVRRIDVPTVPECLAAIGELELPDDHPQDGRLREPDFVVTEDGEAVPYDRDNLPLTKDELSRMTHFTTPFDRRKAANAKIARIDNAKLYAGSPMYYYCKFCGEQMMLTETHLEQPPWFCDLCISEGRALGRRQANPA